FSSRGTFGTCGTFDKLFPPFSVGGAVSEFEKHFDAQGKVQASAPRWARYRQERLSGFPSPFKSESEPLAGRERQAVRQIDDLRPAALGPAYLGTDPKLHINYDTVRKARIAPEMADAAEVVRQVVGLFEGAPNWGHPLTMCNVVPQANTVAIIAGML